MLNQRIAAFVCGAMVGVGLSAGTPGASAAEGQMAGNPAGSAPPAGDGEHASGPDTEPSGSSDPHTTSEVPAEGADWRSSLTAWIWLVGMEGTIGAGGLKTDVSADFGDILEASDSIFAFSGRLEVGTGAVGGFIEGMYSKLGVDDVSGPAGFADVDIVTEMFLLDFGLSYRLGTWEPSGAAAENAHDLTLDLYAGARYTHLELTMEPATAAKRSDSKNWFDPIVGAKVVLPISEGWHAALNGDIGGFGVNSDFTWSTTCVLGYDFSMFGSPATAYLGYRALGQDYSDQGGGDRFIWDIVQHGPIVGLTLRF